MSSPPWPAFAEPLQHLLATPQAAHQQEVSLHKPTVGQQVADSSSAGASAVWSRATHAEDAIAGLPADLSKLLRNKLVDLSVLTSGTALVVGHIKHCQVAFFGCCCVGVSLSIATCTAMPIGSLLRSPGRCTSASCVLWLLCTGALIADDACCHSGMQCGQIPADSRACGGNATQNSYMLSPANPLSCSWADSQNSRQIAGLGESSRRRLILVAK